MCGCKDVFLYFLQECILRVGRCGECLTCDAENRTLVVQLCARITLLGMGRGGVALGRDYMRRYKIFSRTCTPTRCHVSPGCWLREGWWGVTTSFGSRHRDPMLCYEIFSCTCAATTLSDLLLHLRTDMMLRDPISLIGNMMKKSYTQKL